MIYPWQNEQWQLFSQLKQQERLPHAIILTGHEGLGKLSFSNQVAASVLCSNSNKPEPCGQCHSCQLFEANNHPDHLSIMPEDVGKQIKIEQIRQLKEKQSLTSAVSTWKTVIISPADSMNISSSNSLLKLLEEPQENTLLLLLTSKPERLPITITSRCQKIAFNPPEDKEAYAFIQQTKADLPIDTIKHILPMAKGAPLQAMKLIESDISNQIQQVEEDLNSIMQGSINPVQLAKTWQEYELTLCLNHIQNIIQQRLVLELDKLSSQQVKHYWYIYDCIIETMKLISSSNNINKILLIEQFMVSVMDKNWNNRTALN